MIDEILASARAAWPDLGAKGEPPGGFRWALQSRNRVVLFLWSNEALGHPVMVIKLVRDPRDGAKLVESLELLRSVRSLVSQELRPTIPRTVSIGQIGGLAGLAQECLPGNSIELFSVRVNGPGRLDPICQAAGDWLHAFHRDTHEADVEVGADRIDELLDNPDVLPFKAVLRDVLVPELSGVRMPVGWAYGDCHPSNFLWDGSAVTGAVDWEGASGGAWAPWDWFQFAFVLTQEVLKSDLALGEKATLEAQAARLLLNPEQSPLGEALGSWSSRYLSRLGLAPELKRSLFLLFLAAYYWSPTDKGALLRTVLGER